MLGGAGALALGSFLPWAEVGPFSKNGVEGDGVLTLILAIVIAVAAWPTIHSSVGRGRGLTTSIAAALALVVCVYDVADVSSTGNDVIEAQVGIGLWMATAAAIAVLVGVVLGVRRNVVLFSVAPAATTSPILTTSGGDTCTSNPPRWAADPTGRHELRYWNGSAWTDHVSDAGAPGIDPLTEP
jgi:hypothetical protein